MPTRLTPGLWVARNVNPALDNLVTWERHPPIVDCAAGVIARLELDGHTEAQVRAHARAIAGLPALIEAACAVCVDKNCKALKPETLEQLQDALAAAGCDWNG